MLRKLKTARAVIQALGGPAPVSRLTGKSYQAVWNWGDRNRIAPDAFHIMTAELERLGFEAPPELWLQIVPEPSSETAEPVWPDTSKIPF